MAKQYNSHITDMALKNIKNRLGNLAWSYTKNEHNGLVINIDAQIFLHNTPSQKGDLNENSNQTDNKHLVAFTHGMDSSLNKTSPFSEALLQHLPVANTAIQENCPENMSLPDYTRNLLCDTYTTNECEAYVADFIVDSLQLKEPQTLQKEHLTISLWQDVQQVSSTRFEKRLYIASITINDPESIKTLANHYHFASQKKETGCIMM